MRSRTMDALRRFKMAVYFAAAVGFTLTASYSGYLWWLPLFLFAIAAVFVFLAGEAARPVDGRRTAYLAAAALSVPLLISIVFQIIEDLSRSYSSNDYSLRDLRAIIHLVLLFTGFTFAHRAGQWFARRGAETRSGIGALRVLQIVAVPLIILGMIYFALIAALSVSERELIGSSRENVGLMLAHVTFASVLLGVSTGMFIFATKRLGARRAPDKEGL